ncbi:MAG: hypothetical protein OEX12_13100 [Gammaproteobacteria bacterium]|nr:hypothetical protein [Gammaproteobacteria bacterium]
MKIKPYLPSLLLVIFMLAGCAPISLKLDGSPIQSFSDLKANEVVMVGSIKFMPAISEKDRDFSKVQNKQHVAAHTQMFWLVKGNKWLNTTDYDIYEGAGSMGSNFNNHTPVSINGEQFSIPVKRAKAMLISGGYFPATTRKVVHTTKYLDGRNSQFNHSQTEYTMVAKHLNFKLNVNTNTKSKAIYIGDIQIYRDKKFNLKKIVIKDNYKQANIDFKKSFKTKIDLAKQLAIKVNR